MYRISFFVIFAEELKINVRLSNKTIKIMINCRSLNEFEIIFIN